jgi:hypothetical protein
MNIGRDEPLPVIINELAPTTAPAVEAPPTPGAAVTVDVPVPLPAALFASTAKLAVIVGVPIAVSE